MRGDSTGRLHVWCRSVDAIACEPGLTNPTVNFDMCLLRYPAPACRTGQPRVYHLHHGYVPAKCRFIGVLVIDTGHYAIGEGAQNQIPCPVTTYQPLMARLVAMMSKQATTRVLQGLRPNSLRPGTYQPMAKSTSCRDSRPGHLSRTVLPQVPSMRSGDFQPISASTSCLQADEKHFSRLETQLSQTACQKEPTSEPRLIRVFTCGPGYLWILPLRRSRCTCPAGTYQSRKAGSCTFTSTDFFSSEPGSVDQTPCPAGQHQPLTSKRNVWISPTMVGSYLVLDSMQPWSRYHCSNRIRSSRRVSVKMVRTPT